MTSTYRSGINIKFGKAYYDLLGQGTYNTSDGADWTRAHDHVRLSFVPPTWGDYQKVQREFLQVRGSASARPRCLVGRRRLLCWTHG